MLMCTEERNAANCAKASLAHVIETRRVPQILEKFVGKLCGASWELLL